MNSYERVMKRLSGEDVDKIPNMNILMTFAANYIGVPYSKYATDFNYLVEGNIKCSKEFGIDMLSTLSCPTREAQDLGATITMPHDGVPAVIGSYIKSHNDLKKLEIVEPYDGKRMRDRIEAVKLYKKQTGSEYPILGWVEGCFAESADLRGISEIMIDTINEPNFVIDMMEIVFEQEVLFAKAQIEAGADIIGIGDAAASLIGPTLYDEIALPFEKRLCEEIHRLGAKVKLHICGNIEPILEGVATVGADMVDIDHMVDFKKAVEIFKDTQTCACGNMDPVEVMMQGSKGYVTKKVLECIEIADKKTFIAAGCEIPKTTPYENMHTMNDLLRV